MVPTRVSFETSFDSKQPKLVSALSETKRLFRLFRFYTETASFDVSMFRLNRNKQKINRNKQIWSPIHAAHRGQLPNLAEISSKSKGPKGPADL